MYNTITEASSVKQLLGKTKTKIILVTSAFHIDRASYIFRNTGFMVNQFPVDFRTLGAQSKISHILPSSRAFWQSSIWIKEIVAQNYYKLMKKFYF